LLDEQPNAALQLRRAISIQAAKKQKDLRSMLSRRRLQALIGSGVGSK